MSTWGEVWDMERWNMADLGTEFSDFIQNLSDIKRAGPIKFVMLVEVSEEQGVLANSGLVNGVSAKLIGSEQQLDYILKHSVSRNLSTTCVRSIVENEDRPFLSSFEGRIMDEIGIVAWLLEHYYMPPSALHVKDPLRLLVQEGFLPRICDWSHDRATVDYSYRPEYNKFVEAVNNCVNNGYGDI